MGKLSLNWDGFEANIREHFKKLKQENHLFDVTLATDDGQHIQAHKIILSAGSHFFSDIFSKSSHNTHTNMLVYLKGVNSAGLLPVVDFIYNGEAVMTREEVKVFTETGKELQIKGLEDELTEIENNAMLDPPLDSEQQDAESIAPKYEAQVKEE